MAVAQKENPVHEVTDAGELVRRDDGRDAAFRLVHGASDWSGCVRTRGVVDEHDVPRVSGGLSTVRRAPGSQ